MPHLIATFIFPLLLSVATRTEAQAAPASNQAELEKVAEQVKALFYGARIAVGENSTLVSTPSLMLGKEDSVRAQVKFQYEKLSGVKPDFTVPPLKYLWQAIDGVIVNAVNGKYREEFAQASHFQGKLVPARFAHLVAIQFTELSGGKYRLNWTTSPEFLVNPSSRPDAWEEKVITQKFKSPEWYQGHPYFEKVADNDKPSFRAIFPEYFKPNCMGCHAGKIGQEIHNGKIEAVVGTLGGALSFSMRE